MSRWVYLLGVGLALIALGLALTDWALSLRTGVTEANVKRIKKGMAMEEVAAIFAGEGLPGERPPEPGGWTRLSSGAFDTEYTFYHWVGRDGYASVTFVRIAPNQHARVDEARFERTERPSPLARLRAWLGW